jgi:hypothetical protein
MSWASQCCTHVLEIEDGRVTQAYALDGSADHEAPAPERLTPFKVPAHMEERVVLYDPGDILGRPERQPHSNPANRACM